MASMNVHAADAESSLYQQSESVSSTVYSSQEYGVGLRRNIELVKPSADTLKLEPAVAAVTPKSIPKSTSKAKPTPAPKAKAISPVAKSKPPVEQVVVASKPKPKTALPVVKAEPTVAPAALAAAASTPIVALPADQSKASVEPAVAATKPQPKKIAPIVKASAKSNAKEEDESLLSFIDDWLGIKPVKPWQKGTLAKKEMKPGGVVPEFDVFSEKVFSYKQGSVGGNGVGGGGCGCN